MQKNILLLGAPGSGKGTQAKFLEEEYKFARIDTGAIIRQSIKDQTELGKEAKQYVDQGKLIPDSLVIGLVVSAAQELIQSGYNVLFDGFPRNISQAEALDENGISLDYVLSIEIPSEKLIERIVHRRLCSNKSCGAVYHLEFYPPQQENICDACGSLLFHREDDTEALVEARIQTYVSETKPLNEYYEKRNTLHYVNGDQEALSVSQDLKKVLA